MGEKFRNLVNIFLGIFLIVVLLFLIAVFAIMNGAKIDTGKSCQDLTLKECYDYCEDQKYLLSQNCAEIIIELKEIREIIGEREE